jgi:hypothetical protein
MVLFMRTILHLRQQPWRTVYPRRIAWSRVSYDLQNWRRANKRREEAVQKDCAQATYLRMGAVAEQQELRDFELPALLFQQSDDLETPQRSLGHKQAAIIGQFIDGEESKRILGQEIDAVGHAPLHDFPILKSHPHPQMWMNGNGVKESDILLDGTASETPHKKHRLGFI